jgi:ATP-dependent RNA helicase RhlE
LDALLPLADSDLTATALPATSAGHSETPDPAPAGPADFSGFGLDPRILRALAEQGYTKPTPIQAQAIPVVVSGRDVMGAAQTGTGKTAGFSLPIIQNLLPLASSSMSPARHPVRALMLTPTRELADQVAANVATYAKHTPLRSTVVFGGVDMNPQKDALRAGVEILIATPGRLLDHVGQKTVNLSQVQVLVLDEADRMLDMGFLPDLQRIINLLPAKRQNLLFSATFSNDIKKLAQSFQENPVVIEVARRNATAELVQQIVYAVGTDQKRAAVAHIIRERQLRQVLVFSNTKIGTGRLARELKNEGINADAIHGDKSQKDRMIALDAFKKGETDVLVATDVAARGLDIAELPAVINYDLPYAPEDYVHRIGRTGRAGASGIAISLMSPDEERLLVEIEKLTKRPLERGTLDNFRPHDRARRDVRPEGRSDRPRDERPPRTERPERDVDASAGQGAAPRAARYASRGRGHHEAVDEFFLKPYEPSPESASTQPDSPPSATKPGAVRPPRKIAALLGGGKS